MAEEITPPKKGIRVGTLPGVLIILTALFVCVLIFGRNSQQQINLRKAREHIKVLRKVISEYREFSRITPLKNFGGGGSILFAGEIADIKDAELLVEVVNTTNPPVRVQYHLRLGDTEEIFRKVVDKKDN